MKYIKRIYENFSNKSSFKDYLENHFIEIIDNDKYIFSIETHELDPENIYFDKDLLPDTKFLQAYIIIYNQEDTFNTSAISFNDKELIKFKKFTDNIIELNKNIYKSIESINNDKSLKVDYITTRNRNKGIEYVISIIENV
jgi:hypothetical protein